jgi:phage tail sheath protein FI
MAFLVSPGVNVSEIDATTVVPAVSTSTGAIAGAFQWGPVDSLRQVSSEDELAAVFGKPDANTFLPFFTAANFLSYSNSLYVGRASAATQNSAVALNVDPSTCASNVKVKNEDDYFQLFHSAANSDIAFAARYPGARGNSLKVALIANSNASVFANATLTPYGSFFDAAPGTSTWVAANHNANANDEMHIAVIDEDGLFTGIPNSVVERFPNVSKATNAKDESGNSIYYRDVLYRGSRYIYALGQNNDTWGVAANSNHAFEGENLTISFTRGTDGSVVDGNVISVYDQFTASENVDISLLMVGGYGETVAEKAIDIAGSRRDCVAFMSPTYANVTNNVAPVTAITNYRNSLPSSSYAVMDGNWKYQYDKYNDTYRWVPCNGDVAGLCARTDSDRDPWFSPAGFNRGQLKNVIKLAYNPSQANRDALYKAGVNPIVSFPGEGVVLYGDKTLLAKPSAFDRINVRRLFIVLEKAISRAARSSLFEFNDEFTRATFVNLVEPFLRTVQGRRGIYDFRVVCDETNNTSDVIDRNEFVGDIYIKPARSINYIQLNFVAVRTGVAFDEIVGRF